MFDSIPTSTLVYSATAVSTLSALYYAYHRYRGGHLCPPDRVDGQIIVITGATSGIGKATAEELVKRGAVVVLACRNLTAANKLALDLTKKAQNSNQPGRATAMYLDLSSIKSVFEFVDLLKKDFSKIDILINNAAVWGSEKRVITEDGFEEHFQVNHLAPLALSILTAPLLNNSEEARLIFVSSDLYKRGQIDFENLDSQKNYSPRQAYANSKLMQVLCAQEMARNIKVNGFNSVSVYTCRPGVVNTGLFRHAFRNPVSKLFGGMLLKFLLKTPYQGAQTILFCAAARSLRNHSGKFYGNCREEALKTEISKDALLAKKLWDLSLAKLNINFVK